jgi:hypothetical protein
MSHSNITTCRKCGSTDILFEGLYYDCLRPGCSYSTVPSRATLVQEAAAEVKELKAQMSALLGRPPSATSNSAASFASVPPPPQSIPTCSECNSGHIRFFPHLGNYICSDCQYIAPANLDLLDRENPKLQKEIRDLHLVNECANSLAEKTGLPCIGGCAKINRQMLSHPQYYRCHKCGCVIDERNRV